MVSKRSRKWTPFERPEVAAVFAEYPDKVGDAVRRLRELIFETAKATPGVGTIEETLRWGEPSYLTTETKSGSIVRIHAQSDERYALYVHCQTNLISRFKKLYPRVLRYDGNRSLVFSIEDPLPVEEVRHCLCLALRYHLDKRTRRRK